MQYERKSVATRVGLIEKLFSLKMESSESVALYVARVQALKRKLAEQEETVSDMILLYVLLRGLPSRFGTLVTLLKMKDVLVLSEVEEALKNEEERQRTGAGNMASNHEERGGGEDQAHFVGVGGKGKFRKQGMRRFGGAGDGNDNGCFTCGEDGHVKYNCPENKNKKRCDRCLRVGHTSQECRAVRKADSAMYVQRHHLKEFEGQSSDDDGWY